MRANAGTATGKPNAARRLACKRRSSLRPRRQLCATVRAEKENPFKRFGTQLVKVGTQFAGSVSTLTGTAKVSKRGVVDENVVFVAGATGRLGARIVKECLAGGFKVRAGVRSIEKGEDLIETAKSYGMLSPDELARLQLVEYDLFDTESIGPALGNAGLVVSAIGASETKLFDTKGPQRVDGEAAIALVDAAKAAGVKQFIMVTSLGTTKFGWPASALNLFWGVLYWKKQAEQALIKSGMAYTILRPGGMEKPTDAYKATHNLVLARRDTTFGGQVSRLQVAELAAACLANRELSGNKTLEVTATEDAPAADFETLLAGVEAEISMEDMRVRQAKIGDARNRLGQLEVEVEELEAQLAEAEERKVVAERAFAEARQTLQGVRNEASADIAASQQALNRVEQLQEQLEAAQRQERAAKAVADAQRAAARSNELLTPAQIRDVTQPILNPQAPGKADRPARGGAGGGGILGAVFGGGQAKTADVAEELVEEVVEDVKEAPKKAAFGLGSLFGGSRRPLQVEEEVPVEEEEGEMVEPENPRAEQGNSLFGFFKQKTVYADEAEQAEARIEAAAQPDEEAVQRAVTKRGRKSIRELNPRKGSQGTAAAATEAQQEADKPAAAKPAPAEPSTKGSGGFFANLFGGAPNADKEDEGPMYAEPQAGDAAAAPAALEKKKAEQQPAAKAAPVKQVAAKAVGAGEDLEAKRKAAVEAALSNLGADKAVAAPKKEAAMPKKEAAPPAPVVSKSDGAQAPASQNGKPKSPANEKEDRQAWIANWKAKQKQVTKV